MRTEVRSTIGSFISGKKVDEIRAEEEKQKSLFAEKDPVASSILNKVFRFNKCWLLSHMFYNRTISFIEMISKNISILGC